MSVNRKASTQRAKTKTDSLLEFSFISRNETGHTKPFINYNCCISILHDKVMKNDYNLKLSFK